MTKDIWINLYDFPLIETEKGLTEEQFLKSTEWLQFIGKNKYTIKSISGNYKHILSHQILHATFYTVLANKKKFDAIKKEYALEEINIREITATPKPVLITKYLKAHKF